MKIFLYSGAKWQYYTSVTKMVASFKFNNRKTKTMKEITIQTVDQQILNVRALGYGEYEITKDSQNLGVFRFADGGGYLFHKTIAGLKFQTKNRKDIKAADHAAMDDILFEMYKNMTASARENQKNQVFATLNLQFNVAIDECKDSRKIYDEIQREKARYAKWDALLEK